MIEGENSRTAIIFGAGASTADGAPIDLVKGYTELNQTESPILEQRRTHIEAFFHNLFPGRVYPQYEEILGIIEIAIQREETFRGYGGMLSSDLRRMREDLVFSITEVIARKISIFREAMNWDPESDTTKYDDFVKKLVEDNQLENTTFLTMNYDLLLDNALIRGDVIPCYGIDFHDQPDFQVGTIPLVKPHGSLNWLYCPRCITISLTPKVKSGFEVSYIENRCLIDHCNQNRVAVIIPPHI